MARLTFAASTAEPYTQYRFDTAEGSDTPADMIGAWTSIPIYSSTFRTESDGRLPAFRGPDGVGVLYRKRLNLAGEDVDATAVRAGAAAATAGGASGPAAQSLAWLRLYAADPEPMIFGDITRDSDGVATSAAVQWPDGATGTYTATSVADDGAVNAYTVTHVAGGATKTVTQPEMTRDDDGNVIRRPEMTVS